MFDVTCAQHTMQDGNVEAIEVAVLRLIQTYCACLLDSAKFINSTSSCSGGTVTFSSTLAHASDDGTVTATVLLETFEVALSKEENPTITVNGQELTVYVPSDDNSCFSITLALPIAGIVAVTFVIVIVIITG